MENFLLGAKLQHYYDHMIEMRKEIEWQLFDRNIDEDCVKRYQAFINLYDDLIGEYYETFKDYVYQVTE